MNILIVEDSEHRIEFFRILYASHRVYISENESEISDWLEEINFELVSLDYDLTDTTSEAITHNLVSSGKIPLVIIHSDNQNGAGTLKDIVPSAFIVPFLRFSDKSDTMSRYKSLASTGLLISFRDIMALISE